MRRLRVEAVDGRHARVDPDTAHHAVRVLRMAAGDDVVLFDGDGAEWPARVTRAGKRGLELEVTGERRRVQRPLPHLTLATAVPKGPRMGRLLAMVTEAGVDVVVPVTFTRSAEREATEKKRGHWEKALAEAARQSGRAWIPSLGAGVRLQEMLEGPGADEGACRLVASTTGDPPPLPLVLAEFQRPDRAVLLVGPEGGLTQTESRSCTEAGFLPCALGPHVLRVETAAAVAVAALRMALPSR